MAKERRSATRDGAKSTEDAGKGATRKRVARKSAAGRKKASGTGKAASSALKKTETKKKREARRGKEPEKAAQRPAGKEAEAGHGSFPIAALGASAGGLEALKEFFVNMPAESGAGFVVVTHQHPGHVSLLPELIGRISKLRVIEAKTGMRVEPESVYTSPPGALMGIEGGILQVEKAEEEHAPLLPIDHFFRSLAADRRECAICVVLSGTGSDGTLGLKAVKAESGMAMVQSPQSAKYASMPASASSTGLADYVLAPAEMPEQLVAYVKGPYLRARTSGHEAVSLPREPVLQIVNLLNKKTGHDFSRYKPATVQRRIERRMNLHQILEPRRYLKYLGENPREIDMLLSELLISVTSFFRDPEAFEILAEESLPGLIRSRGGEHKLRVWVAGCASGEEAYSVAILLQECMDRLGEHLEVQIFATDLDDHAIRAARAGRYPPGIGADVSKERLERFFEEEDTSWKVRKSIREMIVFAPQNVIKDPPFTKLDLIVCRNVLIYLGVWLQRKVLELFHYALRSGGLLFLGPSETLGGCSELFTGVDNKWKLFRRKENGAGVHQPMGLLPERGPSPEDRSSRGARPEDRKSQTTKQIEKMLFSRFTPTSVVVDQQGNIFYIHGRSGEYLEPSEGEQPRNNILDMARKGLRTGLAAAMRQAGHEKEQVFHRKARVKTNSRYTLVDVTVERLEEPHEIRDLLLVILRPAAGAGPSGKTVKKQKREQEGRDREDVEQELQYTRESLQTTIEELETSNEELKSSNEELQSTNEELQSSNEELETSKEELQSLNEELGTVNAELEAKVSELAVVNDDMQNLLNSTKVGTIFLDTDLRVKRYTEDAKYLFRLIQTDIGRPLTDLASNLDYDQLVQDCSRVLKDLAAREEEVVDREGKWYLMRIIPYRTVDNIIDGVVLTFVGIDRLKRVESEASAAAMNFDLIVQTIRAPVLVLDDQLRILTSNDSFCRLFLSAPENVRGRRFYEMGNGAWNIPPLRKMLEEILPSRQSFSDFRVEHDFPEMGRKAFLLNARRMETGPGEPGLILLAMEEVAQEVAP